MKWLATLYNFLNSGGMQAYGQMQNRFCGGYLNNVDTATTDAKIRGKMLGHVIIYLEVHTKKNFI